MIIELSRIKVWVQSTPIDKLDYDDKDYDYETYGKIRKTTTPSSVSTTRASVKGKSAEAQEAEEYFKAYNEKMAANLVTVFYPCDKKADLYVINDYWAKRNGSFSLGVPRDGAR